MTWIIDTITDVYFIVDVFLNFYTALPNEFDGTPMANRRQIAASYLKGWFFIDFVSSLPIEYIYMLIKYVAEDPAVEDATGGQIYEDVTQVREPGESSGIWQCCDGIAGDLCGGSLADLSVVRGWYG